MTDHTCTHAHGSHLCDCTVNADHTGPTIFEEFFGGTWSK